MDRVVITYPLRCLQCSRGRNFQSEVINQALITIDEVMRVILDPESLPELQVRLDGLLR